MSKEKKPPINISELRDEGKPKAEPGALTYMGEGKIGGKSKFGGGTNLTQILLSVVLSLVLGAIIVVQWAPSKGDLSSLQSTVKGINTAVAADGKVLSLNSQAVQKVVNSMGDYVKKSTVDASIQALDTKVKSSDSVTQTLDTRVKGTEGRVTSLENSIRAWDTRIGALGGQQQGISQIQLDQLRATLEQEISNINPGMVNQGSNQPGLSYLLGGTGESLSLRVYSGREGYFFGKVTLVYSALPSLGTVYETSLVSFYQKLVSTDRVYQCELVYSGNSWRLSKVSFTTQSFYLRGGEEKIFQVGASGLVPFGPYTSAGIEVLASNSGTTIQDGGTI